MSGKTRGPVVKFRQFWGVRKRAELLASLDDADFDRRYEILNPTPENRFLLRPGTAKAAYAAWPTIRDLSAAAPFNGPVERRGLALIAMESKSLLERMTAYFDAKFSNDAIKAIHPSLMMTGNRIVGPDARRKILAEHNYSASRVRRFPWKPFDVRWCYLDNIRPLFSEPSPDLIRNSAVLGNSYFITRDDADTPKEGPPAFFSRHICDYDLLRGHARFFPVLILERGQSGSVGAKRQHDLSIDSCGRAIPNLSSIARGWLTGLHLEPDADSARLIWHHALAIMYSPAYLAENAAGIRQGWPRVPLPGSAALLRASAALGEQLAALLDPDTPVDGVTAGTIRPELVVIAVPRAAGKPDYTLTAGWGNRTDKGITMPGKGRMKTRAYTADESATAALASLLGNTTADVFLNDTTCWANIPDAVWETHIGGYQVLKKWLSYREQPIIGRALTGDEARHVTETARRLAAILLLGPSLDESYRQAAATHTAPAA